jgi:hypothetical protein
MLLSNSKIIIIEVKVSTSKTKKEVDPDSTTQNTGKANIWS